MPNKGHDVISGALTPPPPPPPVVVEDAYQPLPTDNFVAVVAERDVTIVGGDTYIWVVGPDGQRHRHFYAHGDHRAEVFHRQEELHRVMANHGGHLPDHPVVAHPPLGHPGGPSPTVAAAHGAPKPGAGPTPIAHAVIPNKPGPAAKPAPKDPKKS
ncbi:hypothetical protein [Paraburkholderia sp. C35]|uniref:hypothetical protein n=1 Tax=Paraburkholderia sp. C35 TaxID=2126993 RepID=UPI001EF48A7F|nr:hypothetical protein [Paraburkholderia sp. C35]